MHIGRHNGHLNGTSLRLLAASHPTFFPPFQVSVAALVPHHSDRVMAQTRIQNVETGTSIPPHPNHRPHRPTQITLALIAQNSAQGQMDQ
jgi:hypothetical protein